jgi:hypothetical protein
MTAVASTAEALERQRNGGTSWFYWIAALSLINTFSAATGSDWRFIVGLGATQIVDALLVEGEAGARLVGAAINVAIAAMFVAFGWFGRQRPALIVLGMLLFALDGALFVLLADWVGVGFHVFVLFFLWGGFRAAKALQALPAPTETPADAAAT